ncbi:hypothetical protein GCM10010522_70940 [Kribbella solani]
MLVAGVAVAGARVAGGLWNGAEVDGPVGVAISAAGVDRAAWVGCLVGLSGWVGGTDGGLVSVGEPVGLGGTPPLDWMLLLGWMLLFGWADWFGPVLVGGMVGVGVVEGRSGLLGVTDGTGPVGGVYGTLGVCG